MSSVEAKEPPDRTGDSGAFHLVRFEREIFPFLQATQWVPLAGTDERDRVAGAYDVVFEPGVLESLRKNSERRPDTDVVGLLLGRGCECPWTRRHGLRVTAILTPPDTRRRRWFRRQTPVTDGRPIDARLGDLLVQEDRPAGHVLGWFRARPDRAPALTPDEAALHGRSFTEPWQFALLVPTAAEEPTLGILGRDENGEMRPSRLRPYYRLEGGRRGSRHVMAANYRKVERAVSAPGRTRLAIELQHRRTPTLVTAACTVLGVLMGLGLSFELSRANQPGVEPGLPVAFASPVPERPLTPAERAAREAVEAEGRVPGLAEDFERRVAAYDAQRLKPQSAEGYCRDLGIAFDGVHAAYVNLIRERARLEPGTAQNAITAATREKGAIDTHFDESGCR